MTYDVMIRAMNLQSKERSNQEKKLEDVLDKKEAQMAQEEKISDAQDFLQTAIAGGNWSEQNQQDMISLGNRAGVTLTAGDDFKDFQNVYYNDPNNPGHNAWLSNDPKDAAWAAPRKDALDKVGQKFDRALKKLQDQVGKTDLEMNMALGQVTQAAQTENSLQKEWSDLNHELTPGKH